MGNAPNCFQIQAHALKFADARSQHIAMMTTEAVVWKRRTASATSSKKKALPEQAPLGCNQRFALPAFDLGIAIRQQTPGRSALAYPRKYS